jgi:hypothetical protein
VPAGTAKSPRGLIPAVRTFRNPGPGYRTDRQEVIDWILDTARAAADDIAVGD